jgi:uncharacterized protein (TIGR02271 family)
MATSVSWSDARKKEARGINDYDLGEVQDIGTYYVHTQRGIEHKTQFYIPKTMFRDYDGSTVRFDVSKENAEQFIGKTYPSDAEYRSKYMKPAEKPAMPTTAAAAAVSVDILERIPLMTERLEVNKHLHTEEVTITKVPYMETQTRDVPVMHEELTIEEAKPSSTTKIPEMKKGLTPEEYKVTLSHEDVDVRKTPEVKEELIIHKTPVTETRHISEEIRSEKFTTSDNIKGTALEEERKRQEEKKKLL